MSAPPPSPFDLWLIRRQLTGETLNGELSSVSDQVRSIVEHLNSLKTASRKIAFDGYLAACPDREELLEALAGIDPKGPAPEPEAVDDGPIDATELLRDAAAEPWNWNLWIGKSSLHGIGSFEGIGKTRFLTDLCRRAHKGEPAPDGQPMAFTVGTRTLWICSDGHHEELAREAERMGIADAVLFNGTREQPYGFTDLDEPETFDRIEHNLRVAQPGLMIIDTLTNATSRNLGNQADVKRLMTPLKDLALRHRIPIVFALHLNRDGKILGRRMRGWCRTIMQLECPDEDQPTRLRLEVIKTYAKRPAPIGVTIGDDGNTYSETAPGKSKGGRPASEIGKARDLIINVLMEHNDQAGSALANLVEARGVASKKTGWNAIDAMQAEGLVTIDTLSRPKIVHLNSDTPDPSVF